MYPITRNFLIRSLETTESAKSHHLRKRTYENANRGPWFRKIYRSEHFVYTMPIASDFGHNTVDMYSFRDFEPSENLEVGIYVHFDIFIIKPHYCCWIDAISHPISVHNHWFQLLAAIVQRIYFIIYPLTLLKCATSVLELLQGEGAIPFWSYPQRPKWSPRQAPKLADWGFVKTRAR